MILSSRGGSPWADVAIYSASLWILTAGGMPSRLPRRWHAYGALPLLAMTNLQLWGFLRESGTEQVLLFSHVLCLGFQTERPE
jgi:hypothetical protein